jgi:hypothetical protein
MTPAAGAARFLRSLGTVAIGVSDGEGVRHFPFGLVVHVPADQSAATVWRRALAAALWENRLRFRLVLVEHDPGAGEALLRFDPTAVELGLEPIPLTDTIENTLRRLPGGERGIHLLLDPSQIPGGELPDQARLAEVCRRHGAGTPVIEHTPLTEGRWYQAQRVEWQEVEIPGAVVEETPAVRLRFTGAWLENAGDRLALVACPTLEPHGAAGFVLLPRQRVPWVPSSRLEQARRSDDGLVVNRAPFELLPSRRVRAVCPEVTVEPRLTSALLPSERRGARLAYLGADMGRYQTVLLMPQAPASAGLLVALGPGNTHWFAQTDWTTLEDGDPKEELHIPPRFLFLARSFRLGTARVQVGGPNEVVRIEVEHQNDERGPAPWEWTLTPYHALRLDLGGADWATFELRLRAGTGSHRSPAQELKVEHRVGPAAHPAHRTVHYPLGSRFELGAHRFAVEEVVS